MIDIFDQAMADLKNHPDPIKRICEFSPWWQSISWVYESLRKNGDIKAISDLKPNEKQRLWNYTDGDNWKRISQVQAIYTFEYLNR